VEGLEGVVGVEGAALVEEIVRLARDVCLFTATKKRCVNDKKHPLLSR